MAYTVSKLTDHSAGALEKAAAECIRACASEAGAVRDDADLKAFRDRWMARKNGVLTQINDGWLKGAPKEAKREVGQEVNGIKQQVEQRVEGARAWLKAPGFEVMHSGVEVPAAELETYASEKVGAVDITLPGIRRPIGAEHPILRTSREMVAVFQKLGYSVADGPVIETDYYNFEALNFPPNHPARDTQDTLFIVEQQAKPLRER